MSIATIEIASTNTSIMAIPIKILEAAEGFRLKALITAYPKIAMTIDGPITAINITVKIRNVSANIKHPLAINNISLTLSYPSDF